MKQTTLGSTDWALKTKVTRRAQFLNEMEAVVPWPRLLAVIEPHYPKAEQGRPPHPLPRMLRIYFMQQWFNLSDPAMEDALYDSEAMRRFAGIELTADLVPDETTILRFRHLLEQHRLTAALFSEVRQLLEDKKLLLKSGTIVDATIIAAPPSTKNAAQQTRSRDEAGAQGQAVAFRDEAAHRHRPAGTGAQRGERPGRAGRHHAARRTAAWTRARDFR